MKHTKLVIVESPTKAKTIGKFLGDDFRVESSYGHIRDLPKSKLGIDTEHNFEPHYIIPVKARKNVTALKKLAAKADQVILATDEDREGEAIAWHLIQALGLQGPADRIVFHEITESAIHEALQHPRTLNLHLVDAQQARRVLDRLVGYELSPFLWKKIIRGLSAGRVQSVALRLIVEREEEIRNFKPEEYWTIHAMLFPDNAKEKTFEASLFQIAGEAVQKFTIRDTINASAIAEKLKRAEYSVAAVEEKEMKRNSLPPFITSTLQQEANRRLHMSAKQTMMFAQRLYENGLITYMRTDSVNLSLESLHAAQKYIEANFGKEYLLPSPRVFKTKSRLAQEAHEAIRPTNPLLDPASIALEDPKEKKLYDLIWRRFMASQLPPAIFALTSVLVEARCGKDETFTLKANGATMRFDGFLKVWHQTFEEKLLPALQKGEVLGLSEVKPEQHFTESPARYNEASLIKTLEANGIGRPSTYAPIISVIQSRNYVQKNPERRFEPTEIGLLVNKVLTEHFPEIVDLGFTAHMEEELDEVAEGTKEWKKIIREFYEPFKRNLDKKYESVQKEELAPQESTNEVCDKCGKPMVIKTGRFGRFLACTGFPECKNTKSLAPTGSNDLGPCPKCGTGRVIRRRTKRGRFFYGCNRYPECDFASWMKPENKDGEDGDGDGDKGGDEGE